MKDSNPFVGPYADTEPPIQSNVAVGNITSNSATITWKTYENASSQVIYGNASGYYPLQSAVYDIGQGTMSHTVILTGLTPGATYHYRINSRDAAGNLASRADATFTTAGAGSSGSEGTLSDAATQGGGNAIR
jgi:chitodextrinase